MSLHAHGRSERQSALSNLQEMSKDDRGAILVLGDSISAGYGMNIDDGWVSLMNQTLIQRESKWRLINASVSGETTTGGLNRLPELLQEHNPQIVVLELGRVRARRFAGYVLGVAPAGDSVRRWWSHLIRWR